MLIKAFRSFIKDQSRVTFLTGLFLLLSSFASHDHYTNITDPELRFETHETEYQLRVENHFGQKSAQVKTEKKEFYFPQSYDIVLTPYLLLIPLLFVIFFFSFKTRRGYFKSCLSPPNNYI